MPHRAQTHYLQVQRLNVVEAKHNCALTTLLSQVPPFMCYGCCFWEWMTVIIMQSWTVQALLQSTPTQIQATFPTAQIQPFTCSYTNHCHTITERMISHRIENLPHCYEMRRLDLTTYDLLKPNNILSYENNWTHVHIKAVQNKVKNQRETAKFVNK